MKPNRGGREQRSPWQYLTPEFEAAVTALWSLARFQASGDASSYRAHAVAYIFSAAATPAPAVAFTPWLSRHCSSADSTCITQFGWLL